MNSLSGPGRVPDNARCSTAGKGASPVARHHRGLRTARSADSTSGVVTIVVSSPLTVMTRRTEGWVDTIADRAPAGTAPIACRSTLRPLDDRNVTSVASMMSPASVSYTHLTLPTSDLV